MPTSEHHRQAHILNRIAALHGYFTQGLIPTLAQHEVSPGLTKGSRENYLYFTLPPCINFQRSSPAMWGSALKTWEDPETNYLFFPERVVATDLEKVREDLAKHGLSLQRNKHTEIWTRISRTLHDHFDSDPRKVMEAGGFDAGRILQMIRVDRRDLFPYLGGPKLANYWLYILSRYTDLTLTNMHEISIIPDTHVIQCSVHLGLVGSDATPEQVAQVWKELLKGSTLTPVDMHPVLWNWSRNDFLPPIS